MPSQQIARGDFGGNAPGHPAYQTRIAFIAFALFVIFPYPAPAHQGTETSWHKDGNTAAAACVAASHAHGYSPWCYASAGVFTTACPPQPGHPNFTNASEYHFYTIEPEWWLGVHRFYYCLVQAAVACPVPPLPPITDPEIQRFEANPDTSDVDRLSDRMKRSLSCLQQAIDDAGGTSSVGSAYRPPAYNQHLIDVWKKWDELREETNPSCQALRDEVWDHFKKRHKLLESQPPVPSSPHTRGEAFDLTSDLPNATLDSLARGCDVYRNLPIRDRVHFIHR